MKLLTIGFGNKQTAYTILSPVK